MSFLLYIFAYKLNDMKKHLILISLLSVTACSKQDMDKYDAHKYSVELTFNNGDKDTILVEGDRLFIGDGNFTVADGFATKTFASGVRTYKVLKVSDAYTKNGQRK